VKQLEVQQKILTLVGTSQWVQTSHYHPQHLTRSVSADHQALNYPPFHHKMEMTVTPLSLAFLYAGPDQGQKKEKVKNPPCHEEVPRETLGVASMHTKHQNCCKNASPDQLLKLTERANPV